MQLSCFSSYADTNKVKGYDPRLRCDRTKEVRSEVGNLASRYELVYKYRFYAPIVNAALIFSILNTIKMTLEIIAKMSYIQDDNPLLLLLKQPIIHLIRIMRDSLCIQVAPYPLPDQFI